MELDLQPPRTEKQDNESKAGGSIRFKQQFDSKLAPPESAVFSLKQQNPAPSGQCRARMIWMTGVHAVRSYFLATVVIQTIK